jgi:hypothetical protein
VRDAHPDRDADGDGLAEPDRVLDGRARDLDSGIVFLCDADSDHFGERAGSDRLRYTG